MRLLVCGSRGWTERERTQREIAALVPDVLIHGAAGNKGPKGEPWSSDILFAWLARQWASMYGHPLQVLPFPADWEQDGRAAGPIRNARMLKEGKPDRGLAFGALWRWDGRLVDPLRPMGKRGLWVRTGTGDMVSKMLRAGVPVRWIADPDASAVDLTTMPEPPQ